MSFLTLPPEITSSLMFSGAGSGPMLVAATAWEGLAAELGSAAQSFGSLTSGLAGQAWQGPASAAMQAAAAPYVGWLSAAASQASGTATQARAVVSAFESALAATVHPLAVAANRNGLVQLVISNLFGQNAPAIAATEANYEQMWAQDVSAMVGYHGGASAAAAQLTSTAQALQNLPTLAANAAQDAFGNVGIGNIGFNNTGNNNVGINNVGNDNLGFANSGNGNWGVGNANPVTLGSQKNLNPTEPNFGLFNHGNDNVGVGNTGNGNNSPLAPGLLDAILPSDLSSYFNFKNPFGGYGLNFGNPFGGGNNGNYNSGWFNTGDFNIGAFNHGNDDFGFGLTGNNLQGVGIPGIGQLAAPR
jgi:PPE-repeat protein